MLQISCPYCGPRAETEFRFGGDAHVTRPADAQVSDVDWADYLFYRQDFVGPGRERWLHAAGCRQWFNLLRDTRTHAILQVYATGETSGDLP